MKGMGGTSVGVVLAVAALSGCQPQPLAGFRPARGADAGSDGAAGACRRSSCGDGGCQPIALASGLDNPQGLVIDDVNAYWTVGSGGNPGEGAIMKVSLAGGDPVVLASGLDSVHSVVLDATNVYWADYENNRIMGVPKIGGAAFLVAATTSNPWAVGIDATSIYWSQPDTNDILAVPIGGGPVTTVAAVMTRPYDIAVAGSYVFYSASGAVGRAPKLGGQQWILTYDQLPEALAVDDTNVYFGAFQAMEPTPSPGVTVEVAAIEGSTPVVLASPQIQPGGLASDGTNLYWTDGSDGTIMAVAVGGGESVQVAGGQSSPGYIATDCANVYWTNVGAAGSVMKLAKP